MQQHQLREDLFFHSSFLVQQPQQSAAINPPFQPSKTVHSDIDHFLNLESPQFRHELEVSVPDFQESPVLEAFRLGGENLVQSPASNLCSRGETGLSLGSNLSCEIPPVLQLSPQQPQSKVRELIDFLLENSELKNDIIEAEGMCWIQDDPQLLEIYRILIVKFKALRKTREQMTKYLMRKALKFVEELSRKQKSTTLALPEYMQSYCNPIRPSSSALPFKKESADKTMNAHFLKSLFSCPQFSQKYRLFLEHFDELAAQDNQTKIDYLVGQVEHALSKGSVSQVRAIKRLPWTKKILREAKELAIAIGQGRIEGRRGKREQ